MSTTTTYLVSGMTCSHCVSAVTGEVSQLDDVEAVTVDLNVGGNSQVVVTSAAPLEAAAVRGAVEEAGYQLTGTLD